MQPNAEALSESVDRLTVTPADVPPQIRVGDEPIPEQFEAPTGPGAVLPVDGLWTTTLRRHGPLWHLHLPRMTDNRPWWKIVPQPDARIVRIDCPADIDSLVRASDDPFTVSWGELAETVDGVWLTERGYERLDEQLRSLKDSNHPSRTLTRTQKERYIAFERWASGCVLWLNWCFETVELYRHGRAEALFSSPFTLSR